MEKINLLDQHKYHIGSKHELLVQYYMLTDDDGDYARIRLELHPYMVIVHPFFLRQTKAVFKKFTPVAFNLLVKPLLIDHLHYRGLFFHTNNDKLVKVLLRDKAELAGTVEGKHLWMWEFK